MFLPPFQTPDPTIPANAKVVATTEARGVQIYRCEPQTTSFVWVFQAPEAALVDATTLKPVATHSAGPTWTWNDGSAVTGKVLQKFPSSYADAIPSLLVEVHPVPDAPTGLLTPVTLVRRATTQGGSAPAGGCDASAAGTVIRVPYVASYTFYTGKP